MKIFTRYKKFFQQDGQTAVFFALLLPALILFLFVVFDLGWLYLNKSRLQNAAEAAAIAGANAFCIESATGYDTVTLIYEDNENYIKLRDEEKEFSDDFGDKVAVAKVSAKNAATASFNDNLGIGKDPENPEKDSWTKAQVEMPIAQVLGESANAEKIYYAVELTEDVKHIFKVLDNVFSTKIPAVAVAEITKVDDTQLAELPLLPQMQALNETQTMGNWEEQNVAYGKFKNATAEKLKEGIYFDSKAEHRNRLYYDGKWNHFQDPDAKIHYKTGDNYKTENVTVSSDSTSLKTTSANGNNIFNDNELDSLNIDFKQDVSLTIGDVLNDDWDIGFDINGTGIAKVDVAAYRDNWNASQMDLRIHVTINFDRNYPTRTLSDTEKDKVNARYQKSGVAESADSDPLYVRIESEPMVANLYGKTMTTLNSVRQIILNINESASNIDDDDDEKEHKYKYRPLVIFYNGPEKNNSESSRESQPVIVNLKADFRGILFMPNSPVVIIGNNHKFQGFVIAKEFRKLKTEDDYTKFTMKVDDNDTDVFIENVNEDTEPEISDEYVFVSKDDKSFFKISRDDLIYLTADYVEQHVSGSNLKNADDYLLTEYYRQKGSEIRTEAYVRNGLKLGESTDPDVDIIEGTLTDWYEVKRDSDNITFSIRNRNNNFLFYKDGWRIAKDNNGNPKYIFQIKSLISNSSDYVEVKDSNGQSAYVKKTLLNGLPSYIKITGENDEIRFILKDGKKFYYKKVVEGSPTLFVDYHGNVQYTDKLTSEKSILSSEWHLDARGNTPIFEPSTFGLATNESDTHYSRCGVVPTRRRYKVLDAFESGGNYCQDMFFETERARYVL